MFCAQAASSGVLEGKAKSLQSAASDRERLEVLKEMAHSLNSFPEEKKTFGNRVMGCTTQVGLCCRCRFC